MPQLIGLVLVVVLVMGGLVLTGGHGAMQALPFEIALIGGAAIGAAVYEWIRCDDETGSDAAGCC